jgi:propionate CoA-transferase
VIGGVPMSGLDFGTATKYQAVIDHACAFDFIDGGGLDAAFLGFGECDALGNVNASKFGQRIPGCGGFIDISQNAKKVVFMGTFSSGGLEVVINDGRIRIAKEGRNPKFVERIGQTTFSADYAWRSGHEVLFVTERCVFRLEERGLAVIEVAPGIDLERDVLQRLSFRPLIDGPREMDAAVFRNAQMRLRERMLDLHMEDRLSYDEQTNTVYMNYSGLRVRHSEDLQAIGDAVDALLSPLGKRVHSIVNYERFTCDDDVFDEYVELVKRVEQTYYLSVKRYTSGAFLRHKLGTELAKREISSEILHPKGNNRR